MSNKHNKSIFNGIGFVRLQSKNKVFLKFTFVTDFCMQKSFLNKKNKLLGLNYVSFIIIMLFNLPPKLNDILPNFDVASELKRRTRIE